MGVIEGQNYRINRGWYIGDGWLGKGFLLKTYHFKKKRV
jgi:hypothetical protein